MKRGERTFAACPRCGLRRMTNESRETGGLCPDCKAVDPGWPEVAATLSLSGRPMALFPVDRRDEIMRALTDITLAVEAAVTEAQLAYNCKPWALRYTVTCPYCECLILAGEDCPGCRARRLGKRAA